MLSRGTDAKNVHNFSDTLAHVCIQQHTLVHACVGRFEKGISFPNNWSFLHSLLLYLNYIYKDLNR